jgi:hypothetical protein
MGIDPSQKGPDFATVDPSQGGPQASADSGVAQVMPSDSAQMMKSPVAPTQQPTQPAPAAPSVTTPPVAPSPNQRLHSFVSSVLGGITSSLAGRAPVTYTTDASGKVIAAPQQPEDSRKAQLMRIAQHGLAGLAAGSQVPQQKSGLAAALAGMGAGASAQTAQATAADAAAKKEARENDEAAAQKTLRMYTIARGNMLNYATIQEQRRIEEDRDPHRAQSLGWAKNAEEAGVPVEYTTESELTQRLQSDPTFMATHQILPIGSKPVTDPQGNPVLDENKQPKIEHQFALIDGLHDGNLPVTADFVSDLKKYGKSVGVTGMDSLKEGDPVSMQHFVEMSTKIAEGKKKELAGWASASDGFGGPKGDVPGQINKATGEFRAYPEGTMSDNQKKTLSDSNKKDTSGEVTPLEKFKQDREDQRARIKKASDDKAGQNTDVFGNVSTLSGKEFNKRYDSFNHSKQYQTLSVLQGSYDQFQQAVKDIDSGKPLSGAQSVVQLFNAIGISATPLAGKGFRINENTVKEHVEARGLDQSALQKLEKLETGAVITEKQLKDYAGIAAQVYKNSFINAAKEQKRQLGYIDVLPLGNNEPVDAMTASLYLQTAGGDRAKAESALKKSGWLIPQR